jgi:hypothetical protein
LALRTSDCDRFRAAAQWLPTLILAAGFLRQGILSVNSVTFARPSQSKGRLQRWRRNLDAAFPQAALLAGLLSIAALVFAIELPPVGDFPNHLARYWLIAGGAKIAPVSGMFAVDWRYASTNIGADLFVAALTWVVPYWIAGKLLLVGSLIGPPAAAAWLNRILFARWTWWSLSFLLLAWTTTAVFGFLNYQLSLAAALLFVCLDAITGFSPAPKFLARVLYAAVALLIHPFGLVFFVLLLLALTIGPAWDGLFERRRLLTIARAAVWPVLAGVIPVAIFLVLTPNPPGHHISPNGYVSWSGLGRLYLTALSPFVTYRAWIDLLFFAPILAVYGYSILARTALTHAGMLTIGLIAAALSLLMPVHVGDAGFIDRRLPLMATYLVFAGTLPQPFARRSLRRAAAVGVFGLAIARTIWIGSVWSAREADVHAVQAALNKAPEGAAILAVQSEPADASVPTGRFLAAVPPSWRTMTMLQHVPVMAIPWRKAFVPTLFAILGQQPVRVLPPWTELKDPSSEAPDVHVLDAQPIPDGAEQFAYLRDWDRKFGYVLAMGMDKDDRQGPFTPPPQLRLVDDEGYARLYRIERQR